MFASVGFEPQTSQSSVKRATPGPLLPMRVCMSHVNIFILFNVSGFLFCSFKKG